VATAPDRAYPTPLHPLHAFLVGGTVPLFLGALLSDLAYSASYEIQWKNFASWLLAGAVLLGAFALVWAFADLFRAARRGWRRIAIVLLLLAAWILGFIDELVHFKDAWASMPEAVILSAIVALLAIAAAWLGFSSLRARAAR
jgi:uncharacterized membrane protein